MASLARSAYNASSNLWTKKGKWCYQDHRNINGESHLVMEAAQNGPHLFSSLGTQSSSEVNNACKV